MHSNQHKLSTSIPWVDRALQQPWPDCALQEDWIDYLFDLMSFTYGARFADQWGGVMEKKLPLLKRHWGVALAVMSAEELTMGIEKLPARQWPPTLPEFVAMCRPGAEPLVAFYEAVQQGERRERGEDDVWSSPAVYWAWRRIGAYDFGNLPYAALQKRWEAALAEELAKPVLVPVPPQARALPAPGQSMASVEKAREQIDTLKVKTLKQGPAGDGLDWARSILEAGEGASIYCLKLAKAALGRA